MSDGKTTVKSLKERYKKFRDARDWEQFHDPKNLAIALSIEAAELLEHFLWHEKRVIEQKLKDDPVYREEISDELADVAGYMLLLAQASGIDISRAIDTKLAKNGKKYPVEKAKGTYTKYTKL